MARMSYVDDLPHLRRGEGIGEGLRRVVRECCGHARQRGETAPTEDAVHEARRALKRARATLRLGEDLDVTGARPLRKRLAAMARELSPRRDATIARKFAGRLAEKLRAPDTNKIPMEDGADPDGLGQAAWWAGWQRKMILDGREAGRIDWGALAAEDVRCALHRAAKRVCKWAKKAGAKGGIARAHEWRKAVIVLREQLLVVRPLLADTEAAACRKLHALAQRLGKATDYNVLRQAAGPREASPVGGRDRRAQLKRAAKKCRGRAVRKAWKRWPKVRRVLRKRF